jgi:hypothetical protein
MRKKLLEGISNNQCSGFPEKVKIHAAQLVQAIDGR